MTDHHRQDLASRHLHFIGVGGAGMSVIAHMCHAAGARVSGSDMRASATVTALQDAGVTVTIPHDASRVSNEHTVVVSSAIRDDNVELVRAREMGLTVLHRSQALAMLMNDHDGIAVAGAHGKTTTSGMIAVAAQALGMDPSFAVGSTMRTPNGAIPGGHLGHGKILIAEADESDGSFLNYRPTISVVTNIEPDHLDHYGSEDAFYRAFDEFADQVLPHGWLIACADDAGAYALAHRQEQHGRQVLTYGRHPSADIRVLESHPQHPGISQVMTVTVPRNLPRTGTRNTTNPENATITLTIQLAVPGEHNALNAAAALATVMVLGASPQEAARALSAFMGTGRRFELRAVVGDVTVVDDYAHHPTEVAAFLSAASNVAGTGRVLALFQPHLYSRTRTFANEFATALQGADVAIVTDIYGAREEPVAGVTSQLITDNLAPQQGTYIGDRIQAAKHLARIAQPGDLIATIGAGDVTELADVIADELRHKFLSGQSA